jgi:hypothetical protein
MHHGRPGAVVRTHEILGYQLAGQTVEFLDRFGVPIPGIDYQSALKSGKIQPLPLPTGPTFAVQECPKGRPGRSSSHPSRFPGLRESSNPRSPRLFCRGILYFIPIHEENAANIFLSTRLLGEHSDPRSFRVKCERPVAVVGAGRIASLDS